MPARAPLQWLTWQGCTARVTLGTSTVNLPASLQRVPSFVPADAHILSSRTRAIQPLGLYCGAGHVYPRLARVPPPRRDFRHSSPLAPVLALRNCRSHCAALVGAHGDEREGEFFLLVDEAEPGLMGLRCMFKRLQGLTGFSCTGRDPHSSQFLMNWFHGGGRDEL